jgi:hypothetical protein
VFVPTAFISGLAASSNKQFAILSLPGRSAFSSPTLVGAGGGAACCTETRLWTVTPRLA